MFAPDDTIVAVATAAGRGGIGVVRISGPGACDIAAALLNRPAPLEPRHATLARVISAPDAPHPAHDEVVATWFPAPHSYTGQHVVELSAHGSPVILDAIVRRALDCGARLAEPGEFTLRAFLNGKRDLVQAEAVADLVAAATPLQARVAFDQLSGTLSERIAAIDERVFDLVVRLEASLDFPDEGYHFIQPGEIAERVELALQHIDALLTDAARGRMIREGAMVVVAGCPNVGKSSLFNALAGADRAIVTPIAGTTRDLVTERIDLCGLEVTLVDTAGTREAQDLIEREGVVRGARARAIADLVLVVLDASRPPSADDRRLLEETAAHRGLIVFNKCDLLSRGERGRDWPEMAASVQQVSALTRDGVDVLRDAIWRTLTGGESWRDTASVSNVRHIALLRRARACLAAAREGALAGAMPEECLLTDLHAARESFDEIVGARTSEDILEQVFSRFCIGK
jgi:tRNA modification GTPase